MRARLPVSFRWPGKMLQHKLASSAQGQNAKYSPSANIFGIAPDNGPWTELSYAFRPGTGWLTRGTRHHREGVRSRMPSETLLGSACRSSLRCLPCRPTPLADLSRARQNILPHQFRTRNDRIKAKRRRAIQNENAGKSTNLTVILPLITVWLQVWVLPAQQ